MTRYINYTLFLCDNPVTTVSTIKQIFEDLGDRLKVKNACHSKGAIGVGVSPDIGSPRNWKFARILSVPVRSHQE